MQAIQETQALPIAKRPGVTIRRSGDVKKMSKQIEMGVRLTCNTQEEAKRRASQYRVDGYSVKISYGQPRTVCLNLAPTHEWDKAKTKKAIRRIIENFKLNHEVHAEAYEL